MGTNGSAGLLGLTEPVALGDVYGTILSNIRVEPPLRSEIKIVS